MLTRHSYNTVPPHTDYTLTEYGRQAGERIAELVDWLENNLVQIIKHQNQ